MENALRASLIEWLRADPELSGINLIAEANPPAHADPWLAISASASVDWGCKERPGRETRLALEFESFLDATDADQAVLDAIEARVLTLPSLPAAFDIASIRFLRARSEQRAANKRAALLEFRFRLFTPIPE